MNIEKLKIALSIAALTFTLAACNEGIAEKTGESIDDAVTDTQNAVEDACENVKSELTTEDKDC